MSQPHQRFRQPDPSASPIRCTITKRSCERSTLIPCWLRSQASILPQPRSSILPTQGSCVPAMGYYATDTTSRGKQYFRPQAHDNRKTPTVVHTAGGLGKHDFWRKTAGSCYFESEALGDSKPNKKWWNPTSKSRSGGFASAQGQTSSTSGRLALLTSAGDCS